MAQSLRLGGFKVYKDVARISLILSSKDQGHPAEFLKAIAEDRINLPYLTCLLHDSTWELNILVEAPDEARLNHLLDKYLGNAFARASNRAILSIFPHKRNPEITGSLLEALDQNDLELEGFANSPSAISIVLEEKHLAQASHALFEPFRFSAYRTPTDWKLAQKGKEQLYKEVVATYQEQRPKVYGLEYHEGQELLYFEVGKADLCNVGKGLKAVAQSGIYLPFLTKSPNNKKGKASLVMCLPYRSGQPALDTFKEIGAHIDTETTRDVTVFSMNGPHFGDRYGIAFELLSALHEKDIPLLGLNCTIASITGVVSSPQFISTIQAIQGCFDVPSVTKKE
jgi:aspartokinase